MSAMLARLKRRVPDAQDDQLLSDLLDEASAFICAYTRRDALPDALEPAAVRLAAIAYNRLGMEGEAAHREGEVSHTAAALPEDMRRWLNGWRLSKPG